MDSIACKNCGGTMAVTQKSKHNQGLGFFLIILGVLSIFLIFGAPLGILFVGFGIYMCSAKESIWFCNECKSAIPRCEI